MKVLVIAQDAQIRDALVTQFGVRNRQCHCVDAQWLNAPATTPVIPADIGVVINAINPEQPYGLAGELSVEKTAQLASACQQAGITLIQLSGSQVFDNSRGGFHKETDTIDASSCTGKSLIQIEKATSQACSQLIILRTGVIFSAIADNILTTLLSDFNAQKPLSFSATGNSCLVYARDLARVISGMIDQLSCGGRVWGTYHYHSPDPVSQFKFAETVLAAVAQMDKTRVDGVSLTSTKKMNEDWVRPLLSCEKILNTFGIKQLPWRLFVVQAVKEIMVTQTEQP